jgi:hypothetical protein
MFGKRKENPPSGDLVWDREALALLDDLALTYDKALSELAYFYCLERNDKLIHMGDVVRAAKAIRAEQS